MRLLQTPLAAATFAVGLATLTACGGGHQTASSTTSSIPAGGSTNGSSAGTPVTVGETEWHLALSATSFTPGAYTFIAQNKGSVEHSLEINGPGVHDVTTSLLSPGQSADLHVTLQAGRYELWCPVAGHKALGMDAHITVGA